MYSEEQRKKMFELLEEASIAVEKVMKSGTAFKRPVETEQIKRQIKNAAM